MFAPDNNMMLLAMVLVAAVVGHVALLISARWFNVMFVLLAAFFLLSPLSGAPLFPGSGMAKWGRIYATLLMVVVGFGVYRSFRLGPTGLVFLVFVGFYALSGLWSTAPFEALKYKGLYFILVTAGFLLGNSLRSMEDVRVGVRLLAVASAAFVVFIMLEVLRNPSAFSRVGRLAAWGLNGNRIGQTAAPMLVLCTFVALYDRTKIWKVFAYSTCTMLGVIIIYTASRGAAAEAALGCFIVAIPLMRRPFLWATLATVGVGTAYVAFSMVEQASTERFFDTGFATRSGPWGEATYLWSESPIYGIGWAYHIKLGAPSTDNKHSIFMQALAETGIVGLLLLGIATLAILFRCLKARRQMRAIGNQPEMIYLPIAMVVSILAHGAFESAPITGGMISGIMLPAAIAMLDRIPLLAAVESESAIPDEYAQYAPLERPSGGYAPFPAAPPSPIM